MGNKKKRSKIEHNEEHSSGNPSEPNDQVMTVNQKNIQSGDSYEIKEESDIKQEPVSADRMVEVSTSTYQNVKQISGFNERDAEFDFNFLDSEASKVEVKKECDDDKKEEEPQTSADSGEEEMDGQQNQQPPSQGQVDSLHQESKNVTHNTLKRNSNGHKNALKLHKCDLCEYSTPQKGHLNKHLLKHTGERPHGCDFCTKRFTQKHALHSHMKVHVKEFIFYCSGCLQAFNEKDEKMVHEMTCKTRRYECHLCSESLGSNKQDMIRHMRVHSGDKPFDCKECFKQFTRKGTLTIHMKLHASPRSFCCFKCHQSFTQQDERNVHEKKCSRHAYECDICGKKTFGLNKSDLIRHMRTHTGEKPFQCKDCLKKFTVNGGLKRHMKIHTKKLQFKCMICRQGFSKDNKRKAHQRNCHGRCYECYLCNKFFQSSPANLKDHMRTHIGKQPYQCGVCRNTFTQKSSLKRHNKINHHKK